MSTRKFLNFSTLKEDVVYTAVKTVQRLYDDSVEYYTYLITVSAEPNTQYPYIVVAGENEVVELE